MSKLHASFDQLKAFRKEFDLHIEKHDIVCKKGCSYCCYQFVPVISFEINYIKDAVRKLKPSVKQKVKEQYLRSMQHFIDNTPDVPVVDYKYVNGVYGQLVGKDWIPCPFLVDNECSIYEVRPLTCHLHFQLDDPKLCAANNVRDADVNALNIMGNFVQYCIRLGDFKLVPILMILKDIFEKKRKTKQIEIQKFDQIKK